MTDVDKPIFEKEFGTRVSELKLLGKKNIAVLVNGGSFNPIHNGHLEMYVVARNELMKKKLFDDVLIIYCASPYEDVRAKIEKDHKEGHDKTTNKPIPIKIYLAYPCKTKEESYARHIFDKRGEKDRIKICREAFASIDNIPNSGVSSDDKHLSKNMFVWYEENCNAYSIKTHLPEFAHLTFYGLSGSDYSSEPYFTNGINGYSIMVSRDKTTAVPDGFNINSQKIYITTSSNIDTASSTLRPDLQQLRNFIETATQETIAFFINAKDGTEAAEKSRQPRPEPNLVAAKAVAAAIVKGEEPKKPIVSPQEAAVATIRLLKSVPNSILFRLLTYHEIPSRHTHGKYKWGYMQFRKLLFQLKIENLKSDVIQIQHTIVSDTTASELLSKPEHVSKLSDLPDDNKQNPPTIEFLQMSTAHALSLQNHTDTAIRASALNFANANSVGGGVLKGSTVQEETLCMMAPELYVSLRTAAGGNHYNAWGDTNWDTKFYYSEEPVPVRFTTTDEFTFYRVIPANSPELVKNYTGHIISAAAYDWKHKSMTLAQTKDIRAKMIKCIKNMAAVAAVNQNCDVLILGAWGCGAFAPLDKENYIREVAGMFCEALYSPIGVDGSPLKYKDLFKKVIFPIPDCYTYDIFKSAFDQAETPKKIAAAAAAVPKVVAAAAVPKVAPKVAVAGKPTPGADIAEKIAKYNHTDPTTGATIEDFLGAHEYGFSGYSTFKDAIAELKSPRKGTTHWKQAHWMWYIIPVPNNVSSQTAMFFKVNATTNVKPEDFMNNFTLRQHYVLMINQIWECVKILDAAAANKNVMTNIVDVMGKDDRPKLLLSAYTFKPIIDANKFQEFDIYFKTVISAFNYLHLNQTTEVLRVNDLLAKLEVNPAATAARPVAAAAAVRPAAAAAVRPAVPELSKEDKYSLDSATGILNLTFKDPAKSLLNLKVGDCIKYNLVGKEKMCKITEFITPGDKKYSDGSLIVTAIRAGCYGKKSEYTDLIPSTYFNTIIIDADCHDYTKKSTPIDTIAAGPTAAATLAASKPAAAITLPSSSLAPAAAIIPVPAAALPSKAAAAAPATVPTPLTPAAVAGRPMTYDIDTKYDDATNTLVIKINNEDVSLQVGDCIKFNPGSGIITGKITKFNWRRSNSNYVVNTILCSGSDDIRMSTYRDNAVTEKELSIINSIVKVSCAKTPSSSAPAPITASSSAASAITASAASATPPKPPAASSALATPPKPTAAPTAATVPAVKTAVTAVPVKPAVPRPTSAPDGLIPLKFDATDPWTFYRCLMRGYMMAVIDSPPANAAPKTSDTANQRNRLTIDTNKSILDSDNVFYFDDFTITECDIIIGMVTRLSKWIKFKLEKDAPRQYFTSLADQTALLSSADFFVHQLELAFKDSKHIMSSTTNPGDAASVEPTNETKFLDKLTDYSYNNIGTSKVFAKYDAAKHSVKNATRKTRDAISRFPGAVKSAASAKWELTKTGTRKMWTRRVTVPIENVKYNHVSRAIENAATNKADAQRIKTEIERAREERVRQGVVQAGGAQQSFNIDIMAPLKKYKEEKLGKIIEMSDPSMRVENYFELMTKMITTKNAKGEEQVVPAIFGHPLLLYLPFARAFMCGINVYTGAESVTEAESGIEAEPTAEKYTLKYSVPSYYEWEKNPNMPTVHLLDNNKIDDPDFLNATTYSSNFSLLYKK